MSSCWKYAYKIKQHKMEIKLFLLLTTILFYWNVKGQDTLLYKTGKQIAVKIIKETPSSLYVQDFKDTFDTTKYTVKKKKTKWDSV